MKNIKSTIWKEYDKESSHKLFKAYKPWSFRYPSNWLDNIKWFFKSFKFAAQRAKRGYSDYDLWDIGDYITGMSAQALEEFSKIKNGYPCSYMKYNKTENSDEGAEVWQTEVRRCSCNLFCSLESLEDFNYEVPEVPNRNITEREENGMKVYEIATDEEFDKWSARMKEIADDRSKSRREAFLWLADHCEELWQ